MDELLDEIAKILEKAAKSMEEYRIREGENKGAFYDSVNDLVHPRTAAEMSLVYLALWKHTKRESYLKLAHESLGWVLKQQNSDGSWDEYYVDSPCKDVSYWSNVPTGLITISLCFAYRLLKKEEYRRAAIKAGYFILGTENGRGYFRKDRIHSGDALNTDAICAAALSEVYSIAADKTFLEFARRGCYHIIKSQHWDGAFPYIYCGSDKNIHYQAVTAGFLAKANVYVEDSLIEMKVKKALAWLKKYFNAEKGEFDWTIDTIKKKEKGTGNPYVYTVSGYIEYLLSSSPHLFIKALTMNNLLVRDLLAPQRNIHPYFAAQTLTPLAYILLEDSKKRDDRNFDIKIKYFSFSLFYIIVLQLKKILTKIKLGL